MRKRIELPDADVLFGEGRGAEPPAPEVGLHQALDSARRRAGTEAPARRAPAPAKTRRPERAPAAPRTRRQEPLNARLDALERRLGDLPIDSLLTLREDVEELLAAPDIPTVAVERLLERV